MANVYVLGLGNVLMGDDGFGPAVIRAFEASYDAGPDVEVIDLGTPGLDLTPWLADADHVVIVDTVKAPLAPGALRIYDKSDLMREAPFARTGPHDPGVKECVFTLEFAGRAPAHITIVGAVPSAVGMSLELSDAVSAAVPVAVEAIAVALTAHGHPPRPRIHRILADWWHLPETPAPAPGPGHFAYFR